MHLRSVLGGLALALAACGGGDDGPNGEMNGVDGGVPPISGLDPSFGEGGVATAGFEGGIGGLFRVARQPDGKVVAVGGTKESILVVRALSDGSLDSDFGGDGVVEFPWGVPTNGVQVGFGCAIDSDGKIVIAAPILGQYGSLTPVGMVARLLPDGSLDASFGDDGVVLGDAPSAATSLVLLDDGSMLVGGSGRIERLLADGSRDASFGTEGVSDSINMRVVDMAVLADGSIIAIGGKLIAKLSADGSIDADFGTEGLVEVPSTSSSDQLYGLAIDGDGRILVGGAITPEGSSYGKLWTGRYLTDGSVDETYNGGAIGDADTGGLVYGMGIDPSNRVVTSGFTVLDEVPGRSARFDIDGVLDTDFGTAGIGAHSYHVLFSNIVFEPDGAFTAVGSGLGSQGDLEQTFAPVLFRTTASGAADSTFGSGGEVMFGVGGSFDRANAVAVQSDGKVLVGGWALDAGGVGIVRLDDDGTLDTSFANDGKLLRSDNLRYVSSLEVDDEGGILIGGLSSDGDVPGLVVERYLASGMLDEGFGQDGVAGGQPIADQQATGFAMERAPDGTIYLVGQSSVSESVVEFAVMAVTAHGQPETSFGSDGAATTAFGSGHNIGSHLAIGPEGKLVVMGLANDRPTLVRFAASGTLDESFGAIELSDDTTMLPMALEVLEDGSILAVIGNTEGRMDMFRFDSSGNADASFGTDGVVSETFGGNDYYGLYVPMGLSVGPEDRITVALASARDDGLVETGVILRYLPDGSRDLDFADGGEQEIAIGSGSTSLHALTRDGQGRLLAVGRTWTSAGSSEFLALRFQ